MSDSLAQQFDAQAMAVYENGKRVLGYNGTRFLQKIRADGGLAAAKSWLRPKKKDKPTNGFLKLVDHGRLDLSLEALVLADPWNTLFTESELDVADKRLRKYGYFADTGDSIDRSNLIPQEIDDLTYPEGSVDQILVNKYERNPAARSACMRAPNFDGRGIASLIVRKIV